MNLYYTYQQFREKYGFANGKLLPTGVHSIRALLIQLINTNLPSTCPVEAFPYDKLSSGNSCYILYRTKGTETEDRDEPEEVKGILEYAESQKLLAIQWRLTYSKPHLAFRFQQKPSFPPLARPGSGR